MVLRFAQDQWRYMRSVVGLFLNFMSHSCWNLLFKLGALPWVRLFEDFDAEYDVSPCKIQWHHLVECKIFPEILI
jgi:hypothetical protein